MELRTEQRVEDKKHRQNSETSLEATGVTKVRNSHICTDSEGRVKGFPGRIQVTGREESRMISRLIA